ncbi:phage tail assembly chaperone [Chromobacterium violaceum]|uniref:phage tail assembly chaperone n=1 Tax=Chromobacterium violaceum TaxID=536 RepID=UPI00143D67B2|nr:phage tail assembly chaperone [Chromobacterium violaceum]QIY81517.1 phage tail protein [Chromobacterium violaceum]
MAIFCSVTEPGFFDDANGPVPPDSIEISIATRDALLQGESQSFGEKVINWTTSPPTLIDRPAPSGDILAQEARFKRDNLLQGCQWLVQRHRDQIDASIATTLTTAQYAQLQSYRESLRNLPQQSGFPDSITWPSPPGFIKA